MVRVLKLRQVVTTCYHSLAAKGVLYGSPAHCRKPISNKALRSFYGTKRCSDPIKASLLILILILVIILGFYQAAPLS